MKTLLFIILLFPIVLISQCEVPAFRILVQSPEGFPVPDIKVSLVNTDGTINTQVTDKSGIIEAGNNACVSIRVEPVNYSDPLKGVSTLDMILVQRHILGLTPLTKPVQLAAADLNNDTHISVIDLVILKTLYWVTPYWYRISKPINL